MFRTLALVSIFCKIKILKQINSGANHAAGQNLTHADYYTLVIFDYMSHELGYGEMIEKYAPNLLNCVERTKSNPLLVDYIEEHKDNVVVGMGFIF